MSPGIPGDRHHISLPFEIGLIWHVICFDLGEYGGISMKRNRIFQSICVLVLILGTLLCCEDDNPKSPSTGADSDTDTDTDADMDSDMDTDTDTDMDSDTDTDADRQDWCGHDDYQECWFGSSAESVCIRGGGVVIENAAYGCEGAVGKDHPWVCCDYHEGTLCPVDMEYPRYSCDRSDAGVCEIGATAVLRLSCGVGEVCCNWIGQ